ncbi:MAG: putative integrase [Gemmatimonadetes bacterium]|nr:putative integrase [Gemmatimonadota bacterium]
MSTPDTKRPRPAGGSKSRILWRKQGNTRRAYADLRDFHQGRVALIPEGETRATTDPAVAEELLRKLLNKVTQERRDRVLLGLNPEADLAEFAVQHLRAKADSGEYSQHWLEAEENHLARAVGFFTRHQHATDSDPDPEPRPRNLAAISVRDVRAYAEWLKTVPNGRGGVLGAQSRRHHIHSLSNVYKRAISEGLVKMGRNPVAALLEKPSIPKSRTNWLEVGELALLLEAARIIVDDPRDPGRRPPLPCVYEFLATFILTGAREDEVRNIAVRDVHFDSDSIEIRGTKTDDSDRTVPMHPQLREILLPHVSKLGRASGPLFLTESGTLIGDWRKTLDLVAERAGFDRGKIRTRIFRNSYITHRLACIDHGAPMEPYQVAREVGHSDLKMIMRVYARVQRLRVRLEEMAFRVDSIGPALQGRLAALYRPPVTRDAIEGERRAEILAEFFRVGEGMSTAAVAAVSGISEPTLNRLRSGPGAYLHPKTEQRIKAFIEKRASEAGAASLDPVSVSEAADQAEMAELLELFIKLTAGMTAQEVRKATGVSKPTLYRIRGHRQVAVYRATEARIRAYVAEAKTKV